MDYLIIAAAALHGWFPMASELCMCADVCQPCSFSPSIRLRTRLNRPRIFLQQRRNRCNHPFRFKLSARCMIEILFSTNCLEVGLKHVAIAISLVRTAASTNQQHCRCLSQSFVRLESSRPARRAPSAGLSRDQEYPRMLGEDKRPTSNVW